ncbi:MAG: ABC transporter ATP-binding protein [Phycisphaerales bacterium]
MTAFWHFARLMLHYKGRLTIALVCAVISAICFGSGIGVSLPILRVLFKEQGARTFQDMVYDLDAEKLGGFIPDGFIAALPADAFGGLMAFVAILIVLSIAGAIARVAHSYLSMCVSILTVNDIRVIVFSRIINLPLLTVTSEPVTDKISRVLKDSNQLGRGFTALASKTLGQLLRGVAAITMAFWADWKLTTVALLILPILLLFTRFFGQRVRGASKKTLAAYAYLLGTTTESLQGLRVVKVHTAEEMEMERLREANRRQINADLPLRWWKSVGAPTIETIALCGFGLVVLYAGGRILGEFGEPTGSAPVVTAILALGMALTTMKPVTYLWNELNESAAAAERLEETLALPAEKARTKGNPDLPPFHDELVFENVSFSYPSSERFALDGVNLRIPAGKMYAFVGPNGCGKTTLLGLVPRLYDPTDGRVIADGHDLQDVSLVSLRDQIGVVTQETVLFHDTIANNIAYGTKGLTREEIEEAARQAYAEEFIQRKPKQFDTVVGYQGSTLSGGERQRIAIARAILRDPRILILDEATSMIDADSEALITEALNKFCQTRTSLVIAHRLSTVINADQIVVMDQGRIVDQGPHAELLQRCELYQQLCRTQLVSAESGAANGRSIAADEAVAVTKD